jgi:hypothetical protein
MEDFYYTEYLIEYADKSNRAIQGRKTAIMNRIYKQHNWQESLDRGNFSDQLACIKALDELLAKRQENAL